MKNKKKSSLKNRIKGFYLASGQYGKNRMKDYEEDHDPKDQDLQKPEEGDYS